MDVPASSPPMSNCAMLRETARNPRATTQTLRASVSRKTLNKYGFFEELAEESLSFLKKNRAAQLGFAKLQCGGGLVIWARFAAMGPGHVAVIDSTMNSSVYQSILESNVRPSVRHLKLGSQTQQIG